MGGLMWEGNIMNGGLVDCGRGGGGRERCAQNDSVAPKDDFVPR